MSRKAPKHAAGCICFRCAARYAALRAALSELVRLDAVRTKLEDEVLSESLITDYAEYAREHDLLLKKVVACTREWLAAVAHAVKVLRETEGRADDNR